MKDELLAELDAAHSELVAEVEPMSEREFDEKWLERRWGAREIAAHITGWHGQFSSCFERMARDEPLNAPGDEWAGLQSLNDTFASHAKGKRKDEVLYELERAVEHFKNAAGKLPDEAFEEGRVANELVQRAGIRHFRQHTNMVHSRQARLQAVGSPSAED